MRKLASIQVIENLLPIEGADFIELAFIEGWQCIVKKGLHSIGDKVIYCSIDSFLPIKEQYEFLRQSSYKNSPLLGEGFRIKSMKMKKVLSQGLIIPLSDLEQTSYTGSFEVGEDVTDVLGIKKWEVPESANLVGFAKGNFPYWLRKTDQERCISGKTTVITNEGNKLIEDICKNKLKLNVLSFNNETLNLEFKPITNYSIMSRLKGGWKKITTASGKVLIVTSNHRIWCEDILAYRQADDLIIGQKIIIKTDE